MEPFSTIVGKGDGFYWFKDNANEQDDPEVVLVSTDFNGRMIQRVGRDARVSLEQAMSDFPKALIGDTNIPFPT